MCLGESLILLTKLCGSFSQALQLLLLWCLRFSRRLRVGGCLRLTSSGSGVKGGLRLSSNRSWVTGCLRLTSNRARVTGVMGCLRLSSNRSGVTGCLRFTSNRARVTGVMGCLRWSSSRSGVFICGGSSGSTADVWRPDLCGTSPPAASECGCCSGGGCRPCTCFPGFPLLSGFAASPATAFPEREFRSKRRREFEVGLVAFRARKELFVVRHFEFRRTMLRTNDC